MKTWKVGAALVLAAFAQTVGSTARADYLINPTGGTTIYSDASNHDDETSLQTLPNAFSFFGTNYTSVYVSTNGNLNFSANNSYTDGPLTTSFPQVAALWDDHYIYSGTGQSITSLSTSSYYSVTWDVSQYNNSAIHSQFQIDLFNAATLLKGFQFQPGDIAFSYNLVQTPFRGSQASIGLSKGDGSYATLAAYLATQGVVTDTTAASIPTAAGTFILFRPDGNGSYIGAINAVPEPGTYALFALGGVTMLAAGKVRRRSRAEA